MKHLIHNQVIRLLLLNVCRVYVSVVIVVVTIQLLIINKKRELAPAPRLNKFSTLLLVSGCIH